jgi:nitroimidazol reductase NimA-like FMN-containing flavoprotein (pyridoxamine 5'-phosphate oxidase superfamily)
MDNQLTRKILALLDQHRIMTVATLRPDGWPQATTVGYVNEGLTLNSSADSTARRQKTWRGMIDCH